MNAREFCREPGYGTAIVLTWSFDAVFFERVLLQDLSVGDTRVPLVVADRRQVAAAMARWPGQVYHLGRRYVLDTPTSPEDFHPKALLRLGPKGGLVWISTGNVSAAGFGGNQELAAAWKVGPGETDLGAWVPRLLDDIDSWTSSAAARDIVSRARSEPWVRDASARPSARPPVLWSQQGATIAQQIEQRWHGRRFKELHITTGSTDTSGAVLAWAHRVFGVERALVAVHSSSATFDPEQIERLRLDVRFIEPSGQKLLHAKSYWFEGPDGPAAVFGSANCSASAWLRPLASGGNVEAVVVFDDAVPAGWRHVAQIFAGDRLAPREHLRAGATVVDGGSEVTLALQAKSIEIDAAEGRVRACLSQAPPTGAKVALVLDDEQVPLRQGTDARIWEGPLPDRAATSQVMFASIRVETDQGIVTTPARWVDQRHTLREAGQERRVSAVLNRLSLSLDTGEQRRLLEDLQLAMDVVLSDSAGFPDLALRGGSRTNRSPDDQTVRRLDPQRVAVALANQQAARPDGGTTAMGLPVSFGGVLQALFPEAGEDLAASPDVTDADDEEGGEGARPLTPSPRQPRFQPPHKAQRRLARMMETYFRRLHEPTFAENCTATQLVHTTAFPMAIATLGAESGWVDPDRGREWTVSAVIALLHERVPGSPHEGLLAHVRARYASDSRSETFERVVGDGLLWSVSAAVLAGLRWEGLGPRMQRALLLGDIFNRRELVASADIDALRDAAGRLRYRDAIRTITEELPRTSELLGQLEAWLELHFEEFVAEQARLGGTHRKDDPLWRPSVGWVFAVDEVPLAGSASLVVRPWRPGQLSMGSEPKKVKAAGYYVNLRLAIEAPQRPVPRLP